MNTSDYALIASLLSIVISIGALLWNVWQKFIFVKPALQVAFGVYNVSQPASAEVAKPTGHRLLCLTATNMGPGVVILYACIYKAKAHWRARTELGYLNPIHGDPTDPHPVGIGPFGSGLPAKIDVGDAKSFYFPYSRECFLRDGLSGLSRVGINDTYHRNTWCHSRDMRRAYKRYHRDFG